MTYMQICTGGVCSTLPHGQTLSCTVRVAAPKKGLKWVAAKAGHCHSWWQLTVRYDLIGARNVFGHHKVVVVFCELQKTTSLGTTVKSCQTNVMYIPSMCIYTSIMYVYIYIHVIYVYVIYVSYFVYIYISYISSANEHMLPLASSFISSLLSLGIPNIDVGHRHVTVTTDLA